MYIVYNEQGKEKYYLHEKECLALISVIETEPTYSYYENKKGFFIKENKNVIIKTEINPCRELNLKEDYYILYKKEFNENE